MESSLQQVVGQVSKFDGKDEDDFLEWSSKLRVSLSLDSKKSSKSRKGRSGHQIWITIRRSLARVGMMQIIIYTASFTSLHSAQLSLSCGGSKDRHERTE